MGDTRGQTGSSGIVDPAPGQRCKQSGPPWMGEPAPLAGRNCRQSVAEIVEAAGHHMAPDHPLGVALHCRADLGGQGADKVALDCGQRPFAKGLQGQPGSPATVHRQMLPRIAVGDPGGDQCVGRIPVRLLRNGLSRTILEAAGPHCARNCSSRGRSGVTDAQRQRDLSRRLRKRPVARLEDLCLAGSSLARSQPRGCHGVPIVFARPTLRRTPRPSGIVHGSHNPEGKNARVEATGRSKPGILTGCVSMGSARSEELKTAPA